jgi:hypothetical protein
MRSNRRVGSRPDRGRRRQRPLVGGLVGLLLSLAALLGVPAQADALPADATPSSASQAAGLPGPVEPRPVGSLRPRAHDHAAVADAVARDAAVATPRWLPRVARPVLVIGLAIVVASIVSILRDI